MSNAILLGVGLVDNVSKDLARISKNLRANGRNLASVGSELTAGITFPVVAAGAALLKFAGDLDAMKKALAANMGGMAQANAEFEKLKELAKAPGIGLEEAIKGSYRLQGLGESASEARHQMENFAKAVSLSGGGEAQFGGLLQQFTQMKGVGKILGGDIRFMIENAPILGKVLNDAFGTANPEKLRDMGITVDQLIEGMMNQLDKMEGIGGSVKNTLENLWTSIRIGGGEIGLAILSATGFGDTLEDLSSNIDKTASSAAKWIRENKDMVSGIAKLLFVAAASGPIVRLIGNIGMLGSFAFTAASKIVSMSKALVVMTEAAYGLKGVSALFGGLAIAIVAAGTELSKMSNAKLWDEMQTNANKGLSNVLTRVQALAAGISQLLFTLNFKGAFENLDKGINGVTPMGAFGGKSRSDLYRNHGEELSTKFGTKTVKSFDGGASDEELKAAQDAFEARVRLQREMEKMQSENPVKNLWEFDRPTRIPDELAKSRPKSNVPYKEDDVKILEQYGRALAAIGIETNLGATVQEQATLKVQAAEAAYRSMVDAYTVGSPEAVAALALWKTATEELTEAQKKQNAEQEKSNRLLEYGKMTMDGVADAISGVLSEGGGFEQFAKGILKAATAMMKLAVAKLVADSITKLGFLGAIPAIIGGGVLIGGMDALMSRISLAEGGMLTGETMVRAGEYPGVKADPEVISPVSKIQKYIREAVGDGGGGGMHAVIRGDDIHLVTSRAQARAQRRGSGDVITF